MTTSRVLRALRFGEPQTYPELSIATGLPQRACQRAVEQLRAEGQPICSGPRGIHLTADPDELLDNYRRLRHRAVGQLANLRRMQRTAERLRTPMTLWDRPAA